MRGKDVDAKLAQLAEVAVNVGLNLQPGQDLILTAPMAALPLVRLVAAAAYRAGAGVVTPIFSDDDITLARYANARDESFDRAPNWLFNGMAEGFANNAARMAIVGDNPMLLAGQDPARVARAGKAQSLAYQPALGKIAGFDINWSICAYPGAAWARQVFPDLTEDKAVAALAEAMRARAVVSAVMYWLICWALSAPVFCRLRARAALATASAALASASSRAALA